MNRMLHVAFAATTAAGAAAIAALCATYLRKNRAARRAQAVAEAKFQAVVDQTVEQIKAQLSLEERIALARLVLSFREIGPYGPHAIITPKLEKGFHRLAGYAVTYAYLQGFGDITVQQQLAGDSAELQKLYEMLANDRNFLLLCMDHTIFLARYLIFRYDAANNVPQAARIHPDLMFKSGSAKELMLLKNEFARLRSEI